MLFAVFPNDNNLVRSIGYGYDAYGHLSTIVYPDGGVFGLFPNTRGRTTLVQGGTTLYASTISYYPDGGTAGYSLNNGITATIQRNARQLPSNLTYNQGGSPRFSEAYVYDADANLTAVTDLVNGKNTQALGYDGLNRLTSDTAPNNWGTDASTYDPLNNIRVHAITGLTLAFNYDATNRLATLTQGTPTGAGFGYFQYDARGNQTQSTEVFTVTPHTFDAKNQMLQIPGVATYSYDEAGRRIKKVLANGQVSYFFYSQAGQLMYEYNPATGQPTDYLYLNGKLITRYLAGQNPTYLLTDRLGTPVRETDPIGAVTQTFSYRPFGQLYSGLSQQQPGFTGHVLDPESSLSNMQARYQDGGLGQFLSVDPMGPTPGDVLNFNRYAYANNNPVTHTDPDGRCVDGLTCDSMVQSYGKWADANPAQASKLGSEVGVPGVTAMLIASGVGEVVGMVRTAIMIDRALSDSPAAGPSKDLGDRVSEVHGVLDPIAQNQRTTAGLDTAEGARIIGSGAKRDLTPAQRQMLGPGETAAKMPGAHAEVTVLNQAAKDGVTPKAMETTRTICPSCQQAIENTGGKVVTPTRAEW